MAAQYQAVNEPSLGSMFGLNVVGAGEAGRQAMQADEARTLNNLMAEQQYQHNAVLNPLTQEQQRLSNVSTNLSNRLKAGTIDTDITAGNAKNQIETARQYSQLVSMAASQLEQVPPPARAAAFIDLATQYNVPKQLIDAFAGQPDIVGSLRKYSENIALSADKHLQDMDKQNLVGSQQQRLEQMRIDAGKYKKKETLQGIASLNDPKLSFEQRLGTATTLRAQAVRDNDADMVSYLDSIIPALQKGYNEKVTQGLDPKLQTLRNQPSGRGRANQPSGTSQPAGGYTTSNW